MHRDSGENNRVSQWTFTSARKPKVGPNETKHQNTTKQQNTKALSRYPTNQQR